MCYIMIELAKKLIRGGIEMQKELLYNIKETNERIERFKKAVEETDNIIESMDSSLTTYMKGEYDNATIARYIQIDTIIKLSEIQNNIRDLDILKHIVNKICKINIRDRDLAFIGSYYKNLIMYNNQLNELNKYGRIFSK